MYVANSPKKIYFCFCMCCVCLYQVRAAVFSMHTTGTNDVVSQVWTLTPLALLPSMPRIVGKNRKNKAVSRAGQVWVLNLNKVRWMKVLLESLKLNRGSFKVSSRNSVQSEEAKIQVHLFMAAPSIHHLPRFLLANCFYWAVTINI